MQRIECPFRNECKLKQSMGCDQELYLDERKLKPDEFFCRVNQCIRAKYYYSSLLK